MDYINLRDIIEELDLKIVHASSDIEDIKIDTIEISRPGLQIGGYFNMFVPERIQLIGNAEWHYYDSLPLDERMKNMDTYFSYNMPALIFSRGLDIFPEIIHLAKKYDRTILKSKKATAKIGRASCRERV